MHIKCYTHWPVWLPQLLLSLACWHRLAVAHLSPCPSDSLILLSPHTRQTAAQEEKEKLTTKNRIIQYTGLWEVLALSRTFLNDFNPQLLDIHFPTIHPVTFHLLLPHIHKRKKKRRKTRNSFSFFPLSWSVCQNTNWCSSPKHQTLLDSHWDTLQTTERVAALWELLGYYLFAHLWVCLC